MLSSLRRMGFFEKHPSACVFAHLTVTFEKWTHTRSQYPHAQAQLRMEFQALVGRHEHIALIEVELPHKEAAVQAAIRECTGGYSERLSSLLRSTHATFDRALRSQLPMFRHIWLAHRLARRAANGLQYVVRARIDLDFMYGVDHWWTHVVAAAARGAIMTGSATAEKYEGRRTGVPEKVRCMTDDTFAAGPTALMDGYASVFPDYAAYLRVAPWWRIDFGGHFNERTLTSHLHYRGVRFEERFIGMRLARQRNSTCRYPVRSLAPPHA